ncbi:MAG: lytic transglycosylase domain-containing protein [Acidobacteria bacterium]|nr:lytic transglycosylase domain-containing protein [Acidobacteriota bacterium]
MVRPKRSFAPLVAFLLLLAAGAWYVRWRTTRYDPLIDRVSREFQLDFWLVKSLIYEESWYDARARGEAGELGLMQVMPGVAQEFSQETGRGLSEEALLDPETNLRVGCWYLRQSLEKYKGYSDPLPYALARYNAGETRVKRWIEEARSGSPRPDGASFVNSINFPLTRKYITNILKRKPKTKKPKT